MLVSCPDDFRTLLALAVVLVDEAAVAELSCLSCNSQIGYEDSSE